MRTHADTPSADEHARGVVGEMLPRSERAERLLLPIPDAQRLLGGISRSHVYELLAAGDLVGVRLGRRRMIVTASCEALVARLATGGAL
jgi:hypothetical protein